MTDNKTTPEQLVREWLPDFNRKWRNHLIEIAPYVKRRWGKHTPKFKDFPGTAQDFIKEHFPDALEAFARQVWDQACEEQREICSDIVLGCELVSIGYCDPQDTAREVENAPTPEFKLTEKE